MDYAIGNYCCGIIDIGNWYVPIASKSYEEYRKLYNQCMEDVAERALEEEDVDDPENYLYTTTLIVNQLNEHIVRLLKEEGWKLVTHWVNPNTDNTCIMFVKGDTMHMNDSVTLLEDFPKLC